MSNLQVGELITIGYNGDKYLQSYDVCYLEEFRVEAIGYDWIVLRGSEGQVAVGSFTGDEDKRAILEG